MGADFSFYMKTIETHAGTFLQLNISAVGSVYNEVTIVWWILAWNSTRQIQLVDNKHYILDSEMITAACFMVCWHPLAAWPPQFYIQLVH